MESVLHKEGSPKTEAPVGLTWRIHLLSQRPQKLPLVVGTVALGTLCAWMLFGNLLPSLLAFILLVRAASEYLFPVTYQIDKEGVCAKGFALHLALNWSSTNRLKDEGSTLFFSPFATPSALEAFRGVRIRLAPNGEVGDRKTVYAALVQWAPHLLKEHGHEL